MPDDGLAIVLRCWAAAVISDEPCVVILMGNVCKKMKELVATIFDDAWWKASIASIHTDRPLFAATLLKAQTIDPSIRYVHLQLIHTYVCLDCSSSAPIRSPDVVCKVFGYSRIFVELTLRKRVLPLLEVLLKPNSSALTKRTSRSRPVNETRAVIILRERLVAKPFSNYVFGEALRVRSELEELLGAERMKETERAARTAQKRGL